jgi:hypothetical protein
MLWERVFVRIKIFNIGNFVVTETRQIAIFLNPIVHFWIRFQNTPNFVTIDFLKAVIFLSSEPCLRIWAKGFHLSFTIYAWWHSEVRKLQLELHDLDVQRKQKHACEHQEKGAKKSARLVLPISYLVVFPHNCRRVLSVFKSKFLAKKFNFVLVLIICNQLLAFFIFEHDDCSCRYYHLLAIILLEFFNLTFKFFSLRKFSSPQCFASFS